MASACAPRPAEGPGKGHLKQAHDVEDTVPGSLARGLGSVSSDPPGVSVTFDVLPETARWLEADRREGESIGNVVERLLAYRDRLMAELGPPRNRD